MGTSEGGSWIARDATLLDLKLIAEPNVLNLELDESLDLAETGSIDFSLSSLRLEKERIGLTVGSLPDLVRDHHDDLEWPGGSMLGGMGETYEGVCVSPNRIGQRFSPEVCGRERSVGEAGALAGIRTFVGALW